MVGDGFGGRLWYNPTNYSVGSYSAYSICFDDDCLGNNQLFGWGANNTGQLGYPIDILGFSVPTIIPNMSNVKYYSTGYCMGAIKNDNSGWVWGISMPSITPMNVLSDVRFVDGSISYVSFVKNDGTVWSIGQSSMGEFGTGALSELLSAPAQMQGINNAMRVACGISTTYVLLNNGKVKSVGNNSFGLLGIGNQNVVQTNLPLDVIGLENVIDIKANSNGVVALTEMGQVYVWGDQGGGIDVYNQPTQLNSLNNIIAISACADGYHYLALDADGNCYGWGQSPFIFGLTAIDPIPTPTPVSTDVIDIMAGETFSYIVKSDGSLWASGFSIAPEASIWLNLSNEYSSNQFVKLNPSLVPGACSVQSNIIKTTFDCSQGTGNISIHISGGTGPFTYDIGSGSQQSNIFSNLIPGEYSVVIADANGCETELTTTITGLNEFGESLNKSEIIIPNVFSPNGDAKNPIFAPVGDKLQNYEFKVYNRWGNEIFSTENFDEGWNGRINGDDAPEGTYYYILSYTNGCNSDMISRSDSFSLIR